MESNKDIWGEDFTINVDDDDDDDEVKDCDQVEVGSRNRGDVAIFGVAGGSNPIIIDNVANVGVAGSSSAITDNQNPDMDVSDPNINNVIHRHKGNNFIL